MVCVCVLLAGRRKLSVRAANSLSVVTLRSDQTLRVAPLPAQAVTGAPVLVGSAVGVTLAVVVGWAVRVAVGVAVLS